MSQNFLAILPKSLKTGDEIIIKGKVSDYAKEFSINFPLENTPDPSYIAYRFQTFFDSNEVVHNYKNCFWMEEIRDTNNWIDGAGEDFVLTFYFDTTEILIYNGDDDREMQYRFIHKFPMESIQTVHVLGDIQKINELSFRYSN